MESSFSRCWHNMKRLTVFVMFTVIFGCTGLPEGIKPVNNFDLDRYLGRWYEIARLDHSFERGLNSVTATYSLREDGGVSVLNQGFNEGSQKWSEAEGKAYFVSSPEIGHLKVSFFGPFYGSYVIYELDSEDYNYAFVSGMNTDYLWLLSRTPEVSEALINKFKQQANSYGFDVENLIMIEHKGD
mgnify:FL=1